MNKKEIPVDDKENNEELNNQSTEETAKVVETPEIEAVKNETPEEVLS